MHRDAQLNTVIDQARHLICLVLAVQHMVHIVAEHMYKLTGHTAITAPGYALPMAFHVCSQSEMLASHS